MEGDQDGASAASCLFPLCGCVFASNRKKKKNDGTSKVSINKEKQLDFLLGAENAKEKVFAQSDTASMGIMKQTLGKESGESEENLSALGTGESTWATAKKKMIQSKKSNFGSMVLVAEETRQLSRSRGDSLNSSSSTSIPSLDAILHPITKLRVKQKNPPTSAKNKQGGTDDKRDTKLFGFLRTFDSRLYERVGFFDCVYNLSEGDIVLFHTRRFASRLQRMLVHSGGFDHVGIVVAYENCDESCCSSKLKQTRKASGFKAWHTLEADSNGVSLYRFTPACLAGYKGIVCVRHLNIDPLYFSEEEIHKKLTDFVENMNGRPYEKDMLQIVRSANFLGTNEAEDLSSVFCSELVAAAYIRLGLMKSTKRPSNAYIPGDFASKNSKSRRAIQLADGVSLSPERIVDCNNIKVNLAPPQKTASELSIKSVSSFLSATEKPSLDSLLPDNEEKSPSTTSSFSGSNLIFLPKTSSNTSQNGLNSANGSLSQLPRSKNLRENPESDIKEKSPKVEFAVPPDVTDQTLQKPISWKGSGGSTLFPSTSDMGSIVTTSSRAKSLDHSTVAKINAQHSQWQTRLRRSQSTQVENFAKLVVLERLEQKSRKMDRQSSVSLLKSPLLFSELRVAADPLDQISETDPSLDFSEEASVSTYLNEEMLEKHGDIHKLLQKENSRRRETESLLSDSMSDIEHSSSYSSIQRVFSEEDFGEYNDAVGTSNISDAVSLNLNERHIQFLYVKYAAVVNVNYALSSTSDSSSREMIVKFNVIGPIDESDMDSLRTVGVDQCDDELDKITDASSLVFETFSSYPSDNVLLESFTLKDSGWYELKWEYEYLENECEGAGEDAPSDTKLEISFLCNIETLDRHIV